VLIKWDTDEVGDLHPSIPVSVAIDSNDNIFIVDQYNNVIKKYDTNGNFISKFGNGYGGGDGYFNYPLDIAIDGSDNIFVVDNNNYRIQKFDSSGTFLTKWTFASIVEPYGIAVDVSGNVFVADGSSNKVIKFSNTGTYITEWGGTGTSENGKFWYAKGIEVNSTGDVYVADYNSVQKFSNSGTYVSKIGRFINNLNIPPYHENGINSGTDLAFDSNGNIYVVSQGENRIQKYDSDYNHLSSWGAMGNQDGQMAGPTRMVFDSNHVLHVVDRNNSRIVRYDIEGNYLGRFGSYGTSSGQFSVPADIAIDENGNIYVVDRAGTASGVLVFNSEGGFITKLGSYGTGDGQFNFPEGVATSGDGYIYVADTQNYRIQKLTTTGVFVTKWGSEGTGDSQFLMPTDVVVDSIGNVYVADVSSVKVFNSEGEFIKKFNGCGSTLYIDEDNFVYNTCTASLRRFDTSGNLLSTYYFSGTFVSAKTVSGIAVDNDGFIYVSDSNLHSINKFSRAFQVKNLVSSLRVINTGGNNVSYGSNYGVVNEERLFLKDSEGNTLAEVFANLLVDVDWTGVIGEIDMTEFRSYVRNLAGAEGVNSYTLYVPKREGDNRVGLQLVTGGVSIENVAPSEAYDGWADFGSRSESDSDTSIVEIDGVQYWAISGLLYDMAGYSYYLPSQQAEDPQLPTLPDTGSNIYVYIFGGMSQILF